MGIYEHSYTCDFQSSTLLLVNTSIFIQALLASIAATLTKNYSKL